MHSACALCILYNQLSNQVTIFFSTLSSDIFVPIKLSCTSSIKAAPWSDLIQSGVIRSKLKLKSSSCLIHPHAAKR